MNTAILIMVTFLTTCQLLSFFGWSNTKARDRLAVKIAEELRSKGNFNA